MQKDYTPLKPSGSERGYVFILLKKSTISLNNYNN
jgi:hypothetical protein